MGTVHVLGWFQEFYKVRVDWELRCISPDNEPLSTEMYVYYSHMSSVGIENIKPSTTHQVIQRVCSMLAPLPKQVIPSLCPVAYVWILKKVPDPASIDLIISHHCHALMWWSAKYQVPAGTMQIHPLNLTDCYKAVKHILEEEGVSEEWYEKYMLLEVE